LPQYQYLLHQRALAAFDAASRGERSRLLAAFERLTAFPEQPCDYCERDSVGREVRCKWFGHWLVRYNVDSPVRRVVVLDCQWT
jgi:hypothetical protein